VAHFKRFFKTKDRLGQRPANKSTQPQVLTLGLHLQESPLCVLSQLVGAKKLNLSAQKASLVMEAVGAAWGGQTILLLRPDQAIPLLLVKQVVHLGLTQVATLISLTLRRLRVEAQSQLQTVEPIQATAAVMVVMAAHLLAAVVALAAIQETVALAAGAQTTALLVLVEVVEVALV